MRSLSGGASAQVVARAAAPGQFPAAPWRPLGIGANASSTFRAAPRAPWARNAATTKPKRCPSWRSACSRKAGFDVVYPERLDDLCCGQPFESKGLFEAADRKSAELEAALRDASENGRWPIVFDTSPCTYRMQR